MGEKKITNHFTTRRANTEKHAVNLLRCLHNDIITKTSYCNTEKKMLIIKNKFTAFKYI